MTFASAQYLDELENEFENAMQFEKLSRNHDGRMPVASSLAANRASHRPKSRRSRRRPARQWYRYDL